VWRYEGTAFDDARDVRRRRAPERQARGGAGDEDRLIDQGDTVQKQTSRKHKGSDGRPKRMTGGWAWGCAYVAAFQVWAWFFQSRVDPWARRVIGGHLGVEVVWLLASKFPMEMWIWGLAGRAGHRFDSRVALCATAVCFVAALLPIALLCSLLHWTTCLSSPSAHALYLVTPPLMAVFVASYMRHARTQEKNKNTNFM
jgi:hypothetical protein